MMLLPECYFFREEKTPARPGITTGSHLCIGMEIKQAAASLPRLFLQAERSDNSQIKQKEMHVENVEATSRLPWSAAELQVVTERHEQTAVFRRECPGRR